MRAALDLARRARERGRGPGRRRCSSWTTTSSAAGFNQPIAATRSDGARGDRGRSGRGRGASGNYRLTGATLYVTIEPCQMCVGRARPRAGCAQSSTARAEPKAGAIESAMRAHEHPSLNHRLVAVGGVLEDECREVIQAFLRGALERVRRARS